MITIDDLIRNSKDNLTSKLEEELFKVDDCGVLDVSKDIPISFIINKTKYQFAFNLGFDMEVTNIRKVLDKLFSKDDIIAAQNINYIKFDSFYDLRNKVYTLLTNLHEFFIIDFECFSHYNNAGCLYYRKRIKSSPDDSIINFIGFDIYSGQLYKSSKSAFNNKFILIMLYYYYSYLSGLKPNLYQIYLKGIKNYRSNIIPDPLVNDEFKEISF